MGGARLRSGPPPDPHALKRQRDGREWVKLSPDGRGGRPPPPWPLPLDAGQTGTLAYLGKRIEQVREDWGNATDGRAAAKLGRDLDKLEREYAVLQAVIAARKKLEDDLWAVVWALPQAVVWEADHTELTVAMYVRAFLEAQRPESKAQDRTLVKQYAESLLLTTPSLHAMRYVIDNAVGGAAPADLYGEAAAQPEKKPAKRFRVVRDPETPEEGA